MVKLPMLLGLSIVMLFLYSPILAIAESEHGTVDSNKEIRAKYKQFKFQVIGTAPNRRNGSYGMFIHCTVPLSGPKPYAYAYGENSAEAAKMKALAAFAQYSSRCRRDQVTMIPLHVNKP